MNRKYLKLALMFMLIGVSWLIYAERSLTVTITLTLFVLLGMLVVDLREGKRMLDIILRRIYVCVDFEAAESLAETLASQVVYPFIGRDVAHVTRQWLDYYRGHFDIEHSICRHHIFFFAEKWSEYAEIYRLVTINESLSGRQREVVKKYAKHIKYGFEDRLHMLIGLRTDLKKDKIIALRAMENTNLHMAELCYLLAHVETNQAKSTYFFKASSNLAPGTYFGQGTGEA